MIVLVDLFDKEKCYVKLREARWPNGVTCPCCNGSCCIKRGKHSHHSSRQCYFCKRCFFRFDDLTGTVFAGRHQSIDVWIACFYLMCLNISNSQIAKELNLNKDDVFNMTRDIRSAIFSSTPDMILSGEVEFDELYLVAGHKGNPDAVSKKGRLGRRNRLKGARGRGTLAKEKPPIFGMIQRGGCVIIKMCENVKQKTIKPIIEQFVAKGSQIYTDEYNIYAKLVEWGYLHKSVCHGAGEYARDEDGDGFHEVHVNTMEGFWSLLRSWLRPHRGISQEQLPLYLSFFQFVHNTRKRGKSLLTETFSVLLG